MSRLTLVDKIVSSDKIVIMRIVLAGTAARLFLLYSIQRPWLLICQSDANSQQCGKDRWFYPH